MTEWTRVKWSEARQVAANLGWEDDEVVGDLSARPKPYFDSLVQAGHLQEAAAFLGQALPRLEAVAWAARSVQDLYESTQQPAPEPEARALKAAMLWIQDPTENRRRAAYEAAEQCKDDSAERFAALAAFFSGGSIAPENCPPVPAPKDTAGRLAAGAVFAASARSGNLHAALQKCLQAGDEIAARGLRETV
jgi:hypothetical protein